MIFADCSAVILDLDGLVLDTEKTYFIAWQKAAESMGFELTPVFCLSLSGLKYEEVEQKLLSVAGDSFQIEQFRQLSGELWYQYVDVNGIDVKKGFLVLMDVLQYSNIPYCLATNSYQKNALECLAFAGVSDLFPVLVTRDQVKLAKPAPDIFLKAAAQLGTAIEKCVVVEDSLTGIKAAKNAGAYVVCIPSSPSEMGEAVDLILDDLGQLAELIKGANCHF